MGFVLSISGIWLAMKIESSLANISTRTFDFVQPLPYFFAISVPGNAVKEGISCIAKTHNSYKILDPPGKNAPF